jgi:threonine/homoserine/homoserine lactone efflux protein
VFPFLITGVILGLSAGFSPGPLLTLVISQTLRHGIKEGLWVALAPLVTDLPIILITLLVLNQLTQSQAILGLISLVGGLFVLYLAVESLRTSRLDVEIRGGEPQSLGKGVLVNALNPHPYLFWLTVGAPMLIKAWTENVFNAVGFVVGFYACLVGSKVLITLLTGTSRQFLAGKNYMYLMRVLGVLLIVFSGVLFKEGLVLLGWLPS